MPSIQSHTKTLLADTVTPVSLYLRLRDRYPGALLLESSDYHGNENSVSFLCLAPMAEFVVDNEQVTEQLPGEAATHFTLKIKALAEVKLADALQISSEITALPLGTQRKSNSRRCLNSRRLRVLMILRRRWNVIPTRSGSRLWSCSACRNLARSSSLCWIPLGNCYFQRTGFMKKGKTSCFCGARTLQLRAWFSSKWKQQAVF